MHKLLQRQLTKLFGSLEAVPQELDPLLQAISASYEDNDSDRRMMERSMELTSEELLERNKELQARDEARSQFLNTAAHEINTPLTPITLQLYLLRRAVDQESLTESGHHLDILERNVERMQRLARDFLHSARIEAGQMTLQPAEMDLVQLASECISTFDAHADRAGIRLSLQAPAKIEAFADPGRLAQVIDNLVTNALRFTQKGGHVQVVVKEDPIRVEVRDTGRGLTAMQASRLFQPFSQVHDIKEETQGGTGLGLHISRGIIEGTGGTIGVHSDGPGKGSTFWFEIPRTMPPEATKAWEASGTASADPAS